MSDASARQATGSPTRELFRVPPISVLAVVALAVCMTPAAFGAPGLQLLYLIPLALLWWVLRRRTVVDRTGIQVREIFSSTRVDWSQVRGLRLGRNSSVHLVHGNDVELALPLMRTRDLPLLAALSGGRLPDPTALDPHAATEPAEQPDEQPAGPAPEEESEATQLATTSTEESTTEQASTEQASTEAADRGVTAKTD